MKLSQYWFFLCAAVGLTLPSPTGAALTVRVTDGSITVTVVDNGLGDSSPISGLIVYNVSIGTFPGFGVVQVGGVSRPAVGSATTPELDLNWVISRSGSGSSNLTIHVSDDGFNVGQSRSVLASGGMALGNSSFNSALLRSYLAANNVVFNTANLITSRSFVGPGNFSASDSGTIPVDPSFSLTLRADFSLAIGEVVSGDYQFVASPPPPPVVPRIFEARKLTNGSFRLSFTNISGNTFSILASTNVATPVSNWTVLGTAVETANGLFQFTDSTATNRPQRFFKVRSP